MNDITSIIQSSFKSQEVTSGLLALEFLKTQRAQRVVRIYLAKNRVSMGGKYCSRVPLRVLYRITVTLP